MDQTLTSSVQTDILVGGVSLVGPYDGNIDAIYLKDRECVAKAF